MPRGSVYAPGNRAVSQTMTIPAPTGGLNARDSLAMMSPDQAVEMNNLFPMQYGVRVRKGYRQHVTGMPGAVETLMTYAGMTGTQKLFAASASAFYDVTTTGVVGASVAGPFSNSRWQWVGMTNEFGSYIIAVNGVDTPQSYNGTAWSALTITANAVDYPDFDPTTFIHVTLSHRRLWFVQKDTGDAWYLPVDQIQGEVKRFGVGEVFPRGGYLQAIGIWSAESGMGINSLTVFASSEGDIAVYSGFDPDSTAEGMFQLVGVYRIGATVGRRCLQQYGSDLIVLCEDGVVQLSAILSQSKMVGAKALSDIVQLRISGDITQYNSFFGWEMCVVNRHQLLLVNVPVAGETNRQFVMNQTTGAWCIFTGYDANCFGILEQEPYFGTDTTVMQAWYRNMDNFVDDQGGVSINSYCLQAFNYFGNQPFQKRWTMIRPVFNADGVPGVRVGIAVDFTINDPVTNPPAFIQNPGSEWDTATWDTDNWGAGFKSIHTWYSAASLGYCGAASLALQTAYELFWISTDFVFERGAVL